MNRSISRFLSTSLSDLSLDSLSTARSILLARERRAVILQELEGIPSTQTRSSSFQPHKSLHHRKSSAEMTMSHLLAAGAHLGHHISETLPAAYPYIYGTRNDVSIIDMRETLTALKRAASVVRQVVQADGIVVFLGAKGVERAAIDNAKRLGPNGFATTKWLPGTITNAEKVFASTSLPEDVTPYSFMPSLLILLAPVENQAALKEATSANIPTIGICDTNIDPRIVTYPIPANDDSVRTVELIAGTLGIAGQFGLHARLEIEKAADERQLGQRQQGLSE